MIGQKKDMSFNSGKFEVSWYTYQNDQSVNDNATNDGSNIRRTTGSKDFGVFLSVADKTLEKSRKSSVDEK